MNFTGFLTMYPRVEEAFFVNKHILLSNHAD